MRPANRWSFALATMFVASCNETTPPMVTPDAGVAQPPASVTFTPVEPVLRRLTRAQYVNTIHDLFGDDVLISRPTEPDVPLEGSISVAAATTSLSPRGVEQYEALAYDLAEQLIRNDARRAPRRPLHPYRHHRRRMCRTLHPRRRSAALATAAHRRRGERARDPRGQRGHDAH